MVNAVRSKNLSIYMLCRACTELLFGGLGLVGFSLSLLMDLKNSWRVCVEEDGCYNSTSILVLFPNFDVFQWLLLPRP